MPQLLGVIVSTDRLKLQHAGHSEVSEKANQRNANTVSVIHRRTEPALPVFYYFLTSSLDVQTSEWLNLRGQKRLKITRKPR